MKNLEEQLNNLSTNACSEALSEIFERLKKEQQLSQKRIKELVPYHHKAVNLSKISSYRAYPGSCQKHSRAYLKAVMEHFRIEISLEGERLCFEIPPAQAAYHYVYYYWRRSHKLGRALVEISKTGREAKMCLFDEHGVLFSDYGKGTIRHSQNNIFIHFTRDDTESMIVLHKPHPNFFQEDFLMGTYTAARRLDAAPIAGAVLLEKQPNLESAKKRLLDSSEEASIIQVLRWTHINTPAEHIYKVPSKSVAKPNAQNWERMRQELADTVVQRLSESE